MRDLQRPRRGRIPGDILELSLAEILEKIPHSHRGDEQVRQAVVVHVGERSSHANLVLQTHSRRSGDIFKLSQATGRGAQIPVKLVAPS
jgi:hypothetical protein